MIKYSELQSIFEPLDIRAEEFSIKNQDEEIEPYFLVYAKDGTVSFFADGINYYDLANVKAYLEVDNQNDEVIKKFEDILKENGITYTTSIEYIPDDRVFEYLFEFNTINE